MYVQACLKPCYEIIILSINFYGFWNFIFSSNFEKKGMLNTDEMWHILSDTQMWHFWMALNCNLIGWESCDTHVVSPWSLCFRKRSESSEKSSENFQNSYDVRYSFNSADCDQSISCNDEHLVSKVWNIFIIKRSRRLFLI